MAQRGQVLTSELAGTVIATIHPSAALRAPDAEGRRAAYEMLVSDLRVVAKAMKWSAGPASRRRVPRSGPGANRRITTGR
jgi:hypothetical protein